MGRVSTSGDCGRMPASCAFACPVLSLEKNLLLPPSKAVLFRLGRTYFRQGNTSASAYTEPDSLGSEGQRSSLHLVVTTCSSCALQPPSACLDPWHFLRRVLCSDATYPAIRSLTSLITTSKWDSSRERAVRRASRHGTRQRHSVLGVRRGLHAGHRFLMGSVLIRDPCSLISLAERSLYR